MNIMRKTPSYSRMNPALIIAAMPVVPLASVHAGEFHVAPNGDICLPGITGYLIGAERSLVRLANVMGDTAMAKRREQRIEKSVAAIAK